MATPILAQHLAASRILVPNCLWQTTFNFEVQVALVGMGVAVLQWCCESPQPTWRVLRWRLCGVGEWLKIWKGGIVDVEVTGSELHWVISSGRKVLLSCFLGIG